MSYACLRQLRVDEDVPSESEKQGGLLVSMQPLRLATLSSDHFPNLASSSKNSIINVAATHANTFSGVLLSISVCVELVSILYIDCQINLFIMYLLCVY